MLAIDYNINNLKQLNNIITGVSSLKLYEKLLLEKDDIYKFVNVKDIIFLTRYEHKTLIVTKNGDFQTNTTLEKMSDKLGDTFFRSHRSYLININLISEIYSWGRKTYEVKFLYTTQTALMTLTNFKYFYELYK